MGWTARKEVVARLACLRWSKNRAAIVHAVLPNETVAAVDVLPRAVVVVQRAVEIVSEQRFHPKKLDVVLKRSELVRESEVQVDDVFAIPGVGDGVHVARRRDETRRGVPRLLSAGNVRAAVTGRASHRVLQLYRKEEARPREARTVVLIDVTIRLVRAEQSEIVRKVLRGPARFKLQRVFESRRTGFGLQREKARRGSALCDYVDVARDAGRIGRCGNTAGIDLQLLDAQAREVDDRRVLPVAARHWDSIVLVSHLVLIAAADVERLIPSALSLR